ncbi:Leucine-rich repeat protein [Handroanthus impetiginosus]|uniref:Leucine-rich repeat protein n=1 Tax=Handroanthus impetiginosus TaxID=429701 RepID=A0A2G9HUD2_9LAMI|nr:Leucine-rich repeat protein [Handroanthus impetiginosus]
MASLTLCLLFMLVGFSLSSDHRQNLSGLCIESEKAALLNFIQGFNPPARFTSWRAEEDCCKWKGVACNNRTGHIHTLDLRSQNSTDFLQGELRDSLLNLPYLTHLDLSLNDFRQERVPEFIGFLKNLEYLNLSNANLRGRIPYQLGNLSKLQSLDLSGSGYTLRTDSLDWLLGKSDLRVLDLEEVDLGDVVNWLDTVNRLSSLRILSMSACRINLLPASLPFANFTSLEILDLSLNHFNSPIPDWLFNISHDLVRLNLTRSQLVGPIPNAFGKLTSLTILDLSKNSLTGEIPPTLASSLKELYLSDNQLKGSFAKRIANLSRLVVLDVSSNLLKDIFHEDQLLNLSDLRMLDLSSNNITFNMSSTWLPPFQLDVIHLQSCRLGPKFPRWLQTQKGFSSIDISSARILDAIPHWFWNLSFNAVHMNLSNNMLTGKIPDFSSKPNLSVLDMSDNEFTGLIPQISPNLVFLTLARNSFSGPITSICKSLVASNHLSFLDLSYNILSGPLPDCWKHGQSLIVLNLAKNNLSGGIPSSIGHLIHLKSLRLDMNYFFGELPSSLKRLTNLFVMDLGENMLSGKIPPWIGESFVNLMILRLHFNNFSGRIPSLLCQLKHLIFLDLGRNHLSGAIPKCVGNFLTMASIEAVPSYVYDPYTVYRKDLLQTLIRRDRVRLDWKGRSSLYPLVLYPYLAVIDLSMNQLSGEIPVEFTRLVALISLNLSHNNLTGAIPSTIGALKDLESLDLSRNKLSCSIPPEMANLSFLGSLNLSYNNLSGKIPPEGQFQTFEASSFMKNEKLCGLPLKNACSELLYEDPQCRVKNQQNMEREDQDHDELPSFYISMGIGFITAIWVYWTVLLLNESWREAYLKLLDKVVEQILVTAAVSGARLRTKLEKLVSR